MRLRIALRYAAQQMCVAAKDSRRDAQPVIGAYDALALMPTDRAAFSYQPKDLKSVCRAVRTRFLLDEFFGRGPIDLPWTFRDTFRFTFVSLGRKTLFLVARLRHQINGEVSRQVIGCPPISWKRRLVPIGQAKGTGRRRRRSGESSINIGARAMRRRENQYAAKTSYGSGSLLSCSIGLVVRSCHVICCGETQVICGGETQVGHSETAVRYPNAETETGGRNRSNSNQQERLSHRRTDSLWAGRSPFQGSKTSHPARIYARCIEPR